MIAEPVIWFGGDYNPEQWPRQTWDEDVRLMHEAGVNLVTVGVFSWSLLQPGPDRWDFGWLDDLLDLLHAGGIAVDLATPSASPPPWFTLAHPDALAVDGTGQRFVHGSRNHFCPSAPAYRAAAIELAEQLGARYASHPAVRLWHVGNEYGQVCLCDHCADAFRKFLVTKYGELDELNRAWGTNFWSQRYGSWDEVRPPRHVPYRYNPSHLLDWSRFVNQQLLDCYTDQATVLRRHSSLPVTTNFMGLFSLVNPWPWAAQSDVVSDDHYADPSDPAAPARAALTHDLMRSLGDGPWLLMEQAMGAVNWRPHNVPKTDAQRRADVLRAVAHGANGVLSFQWRQSRAGAERFHSAMLPIQGEQTRLHQQVRRIGAELARLASVAAEPSRPRIALVFDWESWWAMQDPGIPTQRLDPVALLQQWHRPLWERGLQVDVVPVDRISDQHALVLAPCVHLLADQDLARLRGLIEAGRPVVLGPFSSVVDVDDQLRTEAFPAGLTDLLGARGEQWWPLAEPLVLESVQWGAGRIEGYAEQLRVDTAQVWGAVAHSDLGSVVVRAAQLPFWYVGALLDQATLGRLVDTVLDQAALAPDFGLLAALPDRVELAVRGGYSFVISHRDDPVELTLRETATDLLSEGSDARAATEHMTLAPRGCLVLMRQER